MLFCRRFVDSQDSLATGLASVDLAKFKLPKRILFVDELPRNTMGKVQKNVLREQFATLYSPAHRWWSIRCCDRRTLGFAFCIRERRLRVVVLRVTKA
jgi:hypothetical protein